jgi:hypothetical protein
VRDLSIPIVGEPTLSGDPELPGFVLDLSTIWPA